MAAQNNKEVDALVEKITGLHSAIAKLPSLSPCPDVDALFTELVTACVPPSPVDVTKLARRRRRCGRASSAFAPRPRGSLRRTTPTCSPPLTTRWITSACSPTTATTSTSASWSTSSWRATCPEALPRPVSRSLAPARCRSAPSSWPRATCPTPCSATTTCAARPTTEPASCSARTRTWAPACRSTRPT
uniref:Nicotianamine synthase n=1 Tax=Triticum urartu TaxID=4572 RepID=A0A8R7QIP4_TRIUA